MDQSDCDSFTRNLRYPEWSVTNFFMIPPLPDSPMSKKVKRKEIREGEADKTASHFR
jgi:hypothetical protein